MAGIVERLLGLLDKPLMIPFNPDERVIRDALERFGWLADEGLADAAAFSEPRLLHLLAADIVNLLEDSLDEQGSFRAELRDFDPADYPLFDAALYRDPGSGVYVAYFHAYVPPGRGYRMVAAYRSRREAEEDLGRLWRSFLGELAEATGVGCGGGSAAEALRERFAEPRFS